MPIHAVLIEPEGARRQRWLTALAQAPEIDVVAAVPKVAEVAYPTASVKPDIDIVVLNADAPEFRKMRTWAILRTSIPDLTPLCALTVGDEPQALENALGAGVHGLLRPSIPAQQLVTAVERIVHGAVVFDPKLVDLSRELFQRPEGPTLVNVGGLSLDLSRGTAQRWHQRLDLTELEFDVLAALARNQGRWISADILLSSVWGSGLDTGGTLDQVHSCIKRLRKKIEPDPSRPRYLRSTKGKGYTLVNPFPAEEGSA